MFVEFSPAIKEELTDGTFGCGHLQVCSAASERCLDPVPLEVSILDRLVQAKRAKIESSKETPRD